MVDTRDPRGASFKVPGLPLEMKGERLPLRRQPPTLSQDSRELLASLGYAGERIEALFAEGVVGLPEHARR